jgi:DMSO/TMAO reductase YedYZ molybdopterin-dependent catalytic subunit
MHTTRRHAGVAGVVAAAVALGLGELIGGLFESVPSPMVAVGGQVIDWAPPFLKDFAIATFGTSDKLALALGTAAIALVLGWFVGVLTMSRPIVGPVAFGAFALLGVVAGLSEPMAVVWAVVLSLLVAAAAGILTLDGLLRVARQVEQPTDGLPADAGRRRFIRLAFAGGAAAVVAGGVGRVLTNRIPSVPTVSLGGTPATTVPPVGSAEEFSVPGLTPLIVPNRDFYRIDTALAVPRIDQATWNVRVHGLVDNEVVLSYDDLLAMDYFDSYVTIACVSNQVGGDLVGNAKWTGVRLTEVLDRAGLQSGATQLVGRSIDGFTVGFPPAVLSDGRDAMIAFAMNGESLPREHGFPARLIVPGLYGYVSATKWLTEIELTGWDDFDAYWVPRGWSKEAPIKTQSRIDVPRSGDTVDSGSVVFAGVAWAPLKGIERVEVRVAENGEWHEAELTEPLSDTAWVQWKTTIDVAPGRYLVQVRATDGTGTVQTAEEHPARPDGATGYHTAIISFR